MEITIKCIKDVLVASRRVYKEGLEYSAVETDSGYEIKSSRGVGVFGKGDSLFKKHFIIEKVKGEEKEDRKAKKKVAKFLKTKLS